MNSKQLATVLIKVLGFYIIIQGCFSLITALVEWSQIGTLVRGQPLTGVPLDALKMAVHGVVAQVIGIYLIVTARRFAVTLLKKDGDE
jgi:hypothetical protein